MYPQKEFEQYRKHINKYIIYTFKLKIFYHVYVFVLKNAHTIENKY